LFQRNLRPAPSKEGRILAEVAVRIDAREGQRPRPEA